MRTREDLQRHKKEYYQKNKEVISKKAKERYLKNQEKVKEKVRKYRLENKQLIKERTKKDRKKRMIDFYKKYKLGKSCEICGYNEYPEILQFHHKDNKDKSFEVARKRRTSNIELLKKEIDKCMLICPNCHSWIHYQETQRE